MFGKCWINVGWFLACALLSSAWCVTASCQLSATFDEPIYLKRGLRFWHTGSHGEILRGGTMPLPIDLCTLPLRVLEHLRGSPIDLDTEMPDALLMARLVTLGFWWLLLWYAWRWGKLLGDSWGARLAVALLAAEPTMLAHACLATTDIAVAACLLAFAYHFHTGRDAGWRRRVGIPAIWGSATILAKASGLAFVPLCVAAVELMRYWQNRQTQPNAQEQGEELADPEKRFDAEPLACPSRSWLASVWHSRSLRDARHVFLLSMVGVFIYCGSDWEPQQDFLAWAKKRPDEPVNRALIWTAENFRVFRNAGDVIARQMRHNFKGHDYYFLGESARGANRLYFPTALSIKLTLTFLLLPVIVGLLRPRALWNAAALAALLLFLFSFNCRVQIGVRFMLPLVAFAGVGTAIALVHAMRQCPDWRRLVVGLAATLGIAWSAWSAYRVWPNALCYTNELWGGTPTGYLLLSDSNYDWGQGLLELDEWRRANEVDQLSVWYFGQDTRLKQMAIRDLQPHTLQLASASEARAHLDGRLLAVSTTHLYGAYYKRPAEQFIHDILLAEQPVARTTTFLIYDIGSGFRSMSR
jgi:hypothetical protein